jgi:molybdenum cofactor cytidylyltransferase
MMQSQKTIAAIILAAGSSSRMGAGRHKLFLPLGDQPVLIHVLRAVLAAQIRLAVLVLGHQAAQARSVLSAYFSHATSGAEVDLAYPLNATTASASTHGQSVSARLPANLQIIENALYQQGMSTSLRAGLQALSAPHTYTAQAGIGGAIILLGDQPLITSSLINTLVACWQSSGKHIVAPLYNGKRGNPVLFGADLFPELAAVTGDEGGRSVIERHREEIATVEVADTRASFDVDTWDAYQQVLVAWQQQQGKTLEY